MSDDELEILNTNMETLPADKRELLKAELSFMLMRDLIVKVPPFAVLVAVVMGGMAYGFAWFILNVLKPFILG